MTSREISDLSWRFFQIVMQAMRCSGFLRRSCCPSAVQDHYHADQAHCRGRKVDWKAILTRISACSHRTRSAGVTRSFNYGAAAQEIAVGEVQGRKGQLNTLFLHMTDGVAAFTTEGKLIHMNPATENLLGVRMEDGLSFDEMFADLDMPNSDRDCYTYFLTNEITRFRARVVGHAGAITVRWTVKAA